MDNINIESTLLDRILKHKILSEGLKHILQMNFTQYRNYNTNNSYHTMQHCLNVAYNCCNAINFYNIDSKDVNIDFEIECLILSALYHDAGHPGIMTKDRLDSENIKIALEKLDIFLQQYFNIDTDNYIKYYENCSKYIKATEYPYVNSDNNLLVRIIRDSDLLELTHNKQLVLSMFFADEMSIDIKAAITNQQKFTDNITFQTEFGLIEFNKCKSTILDNLSKIKTIFDV